MAIGLVAGSEDHQRGFTRIAYLLIWLVIVPTALMLAVGIMMLLFRDGGYLNLLFGILVVTFVGCMVTGAVLALVFVRREANLSKLQLDFVSKVSHELRTPLTSIRMFVDMIGEMDDDPEQMRVCLEVLRKETGRLSERIERLLDWGRMESGRRVYDLRDDDAGVVARAAVEAFESATLGQERPVKLDIQAGALPVHADREALVDALMNLLSNAVKYSGPDTDVCLKVEADARATRFSVIDEGIGIPLREHSRIFQKFYRADDRLSRVVEGSGLGLAIVHHVASAHAGKVAVDSAPGRGSTFTLTIPHPRQRRSAPGGLASAS